MRRVHHRYEPPKDSYDHDYEKQMAGQVAFILFLISALSCIIAFLWLLVNGMMTMLVFAQ